MRRQEILLNLFLLTVIGCLAYVILTPAPQEELRPIKIAKNDTENPGSETAYNPQKAAETWKKFGINPIFQALLTPTPSPSPTTPAPTPTPQIGRFIGTWHLMGIIEKEAAIEDTAKTQKDPDNATFQMKIGDTKAVTNEKGETHTVTLEKMDEESDNPSVTFGMDGTTDKHTLRMMQDTGSPGAEAAPAAAPGAAPAP